MTNEVSEQRSKRILKQLKEKYPNAERFDLDGLGLHFVCEVEPTKDHPEYDRAVEVVISSKPHKHLKTTQYYTIIPGTLGLHVQDKIITLNPGDKHTVLPNTIHWAEGDNECWLEIYSEPGWTKEDHVAVTVEQD